MFAILRNKKKKKTVLSSRSHRALLCSQQVHKEWGREAGEGEGEVGGGGGQAGVEWSLGMDVYGFTVKHSAESLCSTADQYIGSGAVAFSQ